MDTTQKLTGSSGQNQSPKHPQPPKHIPTEIWIHICTFLDPKSIDAASKACRRWRVAFQQHRPVKCTVIWLSDITDQEVDSTLACMPHEPQQLCISIPRHNSRSKSQVYQSLHSFSQAEIDARMATIQAAKMAQKPYPMLHLLTALEYTRDVGGSPTRLVYDQVRDRLVTLIMISPFTQLTQVSIKDISMVPVNMILKKCSRLRELSISYVYWGTVTWDENENLSHGSLSSTFSWANEECSGQGQSGSVRRIRNTQVPLQSLVLHKVAITFHSLIQWLNHLPRLDTLRLQTMRLVGADLCTPLAALISSAQSSTPTSGPHARYCSRSTSRLIPSTADGLTPRSSTPSRWVPHGSKNSRWRV